MTSWNLFVIFVFWHTNWNIERLMVHVEMWYNFQSRKTSVKLRFYFPMIWSLNLLGSFRCLVGFSFTCGVISVSGGLVSVFSPIGSLDSISSDGSSSSAICSMSSLACRPTFCIYFFIWLVFFIFLPFSSFSTTTAFPFLSMTLYGFSSKFVATLSYWNLFSSSIRSPCSISLFLVLLVLFTYSFFYFFIWHTQYITFHTSHTTNKHF